MTQADNKHAMSSFVQEEMAQALIEAIAPLITQLSPITRLRLLAFMHLLESPEKVKASLDIGPSGSMHLTLAASGLRSKKPRY